MSEHTHRKPVVDDVVRLGRALRQQSPTSYNSDAALSTPANAPGSLDATTTRTDRRLGISITLRFDDASHLTLAAPRGRSVTRGTCRNDGVALTLQRMEARDHDRPSDG